MENNFKNNWNCLEVPVVLLYNFNWPVFPGSAFRFHGEDETGQAVQDSGAGGK